MTWFNSKAAEVLTKRKVFLPFLKEDKNNRVETNWLNIRISLNQTKIFRGSNSRRPHLIHFSAICTETLHRRTLPRTC